MRGLAVEAGEGAWGAEEWVLRATFQTVTPRTAAASSARVRGGIYRFWRRGSAVPGAQGVVGVAASTGQGEGNGGSQEGEGEFDAVRVEEAGLHVHEKERAEHVQGKEGSHDAGEEARDQGGAAQQFDEGDQGGGECGDGGTPIPVKASTVPGRV